MRPAAELSCWSTSNSAWPAGHPPDNLAQRAKRPRSCRWRHQDGARLTIQLHPKRGANQPGHADARPQAALQFIGRRCDLTQAPNLPQKHAHIGRVVATLDFFQLLDAERRPNPTHYHLFIARLDRSTSVLQWMAPRP